MAYSAENLLPTPGGYATPEQLRSAREYAEALMSPEGQQPVKHWLQGVNNVVKSLVGGAVSSDADAKQRAAIGAAAHDARPDFGSAPMSDASTKMTGDMDEYKRAIAAKETGGHANPYAVVGVETNGDRPHGKYQVMGNNVGPWTEEALGQRLTPAQFLASPEAQEKVFEHKFGQYLDKYGNPQDAASMWFSGRPAAQSAGLRDKLGTSGANYVDSFTQALAGPGGMPVTPGTRTAMLDPASASLGAGASASAGGGPAGPAAGAPDTPAAPGGGGPNEPVRVAQAGGAAGGASGVGGPIAVGTFVPPGTFPRRPHVTPEQYQAVMANPYASPEQKKSIADAWSAQFQPMAIPFKEGVLYANPQNPRQQWHVPNVITDTIKANGVEVPVRRYFDIRSGRIVTLPVDEGGPAGAAGGRPGSGYNSGRVQDVVNQSIEDQARKKGREEQTAVMAKSYAEKQSKLEETAQVIQNEELPQINLLTKIIDDPKYYSGFMSGDLATLSQIGKALGVGDGEMATLHQYAKKLGSAQSLQQIRVMGESGAVKVPEMHMIEKANYDPSNTIEANRAVVDIRRRIAERQIEMAERAQAYADDHNGFIDRGFDRETRDYYKNKPLFTPDELKHYNEHLFPTKPPGPLGATPPPAAPGTRRERYDPKTDTMVPVQ